MAVTVNDIATMLGRTAPVQGTDEYARWQTWISDARFLIEARRKAVAPERELDEQTVDYVVREAVMAHVRRPDDATTVATSVDDASMQRVYRSSAGRVAILDEWWQLLGLGRGGKAFAVDMIGVQRASHLPWCNLMLGASWCSCGADIAGRPIYEGADDAL